MLGTLTIKYFAMWMWSTFCDYSMPCSFKWS